MNRGPSPKDGTRCPYLSRRRERKKALMPNQLVQFTVTVNDRPVFKTSEYDRAVRYCKRCGKATLRVEQLPTASL